MVDASLRMSIVNLFKTLRDDLGVSIIYITHDLATAYYISDRIIIMQNGRVVEGGDARQCSTRRSIPIRSASRPRSSRSSRSARRTPSKPEPARSVRT